MINYISDYLIKSPAYNNFVDNNIILNNEIPKEIINKIIPDTTKLMNHYLSNTYNYSSSSGVLLPEEWKEYKTEY